MKIQEALSGAEPCDDVPRLDLSTLTDDSNWAGQCFFLLFFYLSLSLSLHMGGSCKSALPTLCPHAVDLIK